MSKYITDISERTKRYVLNYAKEQLANELSGSMLEALGMSKEKFKEWKEQKETRKKEITDLLNGPNGDDITMEILKSQMEIMEDLYEDDL